MISCNIVPTTRADLDAVMDIFEAAVRYQQARGFELWPQFSRELIEREMDEQRHFKISAAGIMVAIFTVQYADPLIWGEERNAEPALYLHRIAVHPHHKGKRWMEVIRQWALGHARQLEKRFVRMDTWGNNVNLRNYYIACGFRYLGQQTLSPSKDNIPHYGGDYLSLFELTVDDIKT